MPPRFHSDVVDVALPVPIALLCYHVAREGVMNASMHGKPQDVWVTVAQIEGEIVLRVRDNGIGFDPGTLETTPNSGIAMMLERVDTGRGALEITSSPDTGTMVTATFPLAD